MQIRSFLNLIAGLALLVSVAGCQKRVVVQNPTTKSTSRSASAAKGLPPGQAKKVYGHQSAKAFAPGQQKKNTTTVVVINGKEPEGKGNSGKGKSGKKKK